ncbi:MAG TPA: ribosome-associated translation inhibitor RaiA [Polyangia bacterium]|jgi:putative sigma-54 modulation protein|nr:ribosome-associated translation inhibitor RaiA [Polyangia bacterium]
MQLSVTFRHMDTSEALREYAKEKVERINKYFSDPIKGHVVLACERGYHHQADVTLTLRNGLVIKGVETTEDMYSSIDLVMAKIERQVRRYKEKIRSHRPATMPEVEIRYSVVSLPEEPAAEAAPATSPAPQAVEAPHIIKESKFFAKALAVEEAVMQMNLLGNSFFVFTNSVSGEVNVIYKREDGTYGLIETGAAAKATAA